MKNHIKPKKYTHALLLVVIVGCSSPTSKNHSTSPSYKLTQQQKSAVQVTARHSVDKSILGENPLLIHNLRARKVTKSPSESYIELCAYAYSGEKTIIGRKRLQWFYGQFPSVNSNNFIIDVPKGTTDRPLMLLLRKCEARGLK